MAPGCGLATDPGCCTGVVAGCACCAIAGSAKTKNAIMVSTKIRRADFARSIGPDGSQVCIDVPPRRFKKLGILFTNALSGNSRNALPHQEPWFEVWPRWKFTGLGSRHKTHLLPYQ